MLNVFGIFWHNDIEIGLKLDVNIIQLYSIDKGTHAKESPSSVAHINWMIGQSHGDFPASPQELVAQVKVVYDVINVMARSPWVKHR